MRDLKINLITGKNILEFDSDSIPRLPTKTDKLKIAGRYFEIENSDIEYLIEDEQVFNVFNFYIFDVDKRKSEQKKKDADDILNMFVKRDPYDGSVIGDSYRELAIKDWSKYFKSK